LNITKIEERKIDLERKNIDVFDVIDKSVSANRSHAQEKNIEIEIDIQKGIPEVWADEDTVMQVLANLLNNAIKYTPGRRKIQVSAAHSRPDPRLSGEVEVRVKDAGIGIPPEHLERVFEKFYRIDRPAGVGEGGTGLGLYFSRYIVERHGGRIWAESNEGKGSTFAFTLPVAGKSEMRGELSYSVQANDLLRYSKKVKENISVLVVDDDKKVRGFLRCYMEEEGFEVYEAENGSNALEFARNKKPSVILLDAVMPGMDGYEVMEALNENEVTKHIPVIVLSGAENSKVAMELGAASYLVKPLERKMLIKAVDEILSRATSK
jgi:CheY-like chemotaxis protein